MKIKEEKIKTKWGTEGVFYSVMIGGEKYVSKIVSLYKEANQESIEKWKKIAKQQVINKLNENNSI